MEFWKLIIRSVFRHRLRSFLTILGVAAAMAAFCILRTLVAAWYLGVDFASADRLVTRNKTSLIYMLPVAYEQRIRQITGVKRVGRGIWYGGIYKDKKNFFAQYAISGSEYLSIYPEFVLSDAERKTFDTERKACIAGRKLAKRFGWKVGDVIPLKGAIFPVNVELTLAGIYRGATTGIDETAFFFRWDYLNELLKVSVSDRADKAGWYVVQVADPDRAAEYCEEIDALFRNSLAETLTETEKAFQLGFVAMTDAIVASIQVVSVMVIGIILFVLANTMAMTARERTSEYAVLKALGFGPGFIFMLIAGESVALSMIGGTIGALISFPGARIFQKQLELYLPVFEIKPLVIVLIFVVSFLVGLAAALPPAWRMARIPISEGLAHVG